MIILFIFSSVVLFYTLIGYKLILKMLTKNSKFSFRKKYTPKITVIIPSHNGEKYIENKIKNLFKVNYPKNKMNIILVDDSTDNTVNIAQKHSIKIIHFNKRIGKIRAINVGLKNANTDVIVLTDVDVTLHKDALKNIVTPLYKKEIGGVTSRIVFKLPKHINYKEGLIYYQSQENEIRELEGKLDSVSSMDGRLCAFKKSIIDELDENSLADDLELAIVIRKKGFRTILNSKAIVYDRPPTNITEEIRQKRRRSAYTIQTTFKNINLLLNGPFLYRFIFFSRKVLILFTPLFLILSLGVIFFLGNFILMGLIILFLLFIVFSQKIREISVYFLIVNTGLILGWLDILAKKPNKI